MQRADTNEQLTARHGQKCQICDQIDVAANTEALLGNDTKAEPERIISTKTSCEQAK